MATQLRHEIFEGSLTGLPADVSLWTDEQLYDEGFMNPVFFCKYFLGELFADEMPWVHRGIASVLWQTTDFLLEYGQLDKIFRHFTYKEDPADDESTDLPMFVEEEDGSITLVKDNKVLLRLPRGFSKTTLVLAYILWCICYRTTKFVVFVSAAEAHATELLKTVRWHLETNEQIKAVFGSVVPARSSNLAWSTDLIETTSGVIVAARGRTGQVRGLNVKGHRPTTIILDDLEDLATVATPEQRQKVKNQIVQSVLPAASQTSKTDTRFIAIGTTLHPEALLEDLARSKLWKTITFGSIDLDGEPLWPGVFTFEVLDALKQQFVEIGNLPGFYLEYFNDTSSQETAIFKKEWIQVVPTKPEDIVFRSIALDPAISDKLGADFTAFAVVGITNKGIIVVLEEYLERGMTPRAQIDKLFELQLRHGPCHVGIEAIAFQRALIHIMTEEMFRPVPEGEKPRERFLITPIVHGKVAKHERVVGTIQPRIAAGYLVFHQRCLGIEVSLLEWPRGKKDGADALAMAITLLDPHAPLAAQATGKSLESDQYEPLSKVMGNDFRKDIP